jgi:hypothetical protein
MSNMNLSKVVESNPVAKAVAEALLAKGSRDKGVVDVRQFAYRRMRGTPFKEVVRAFQDYADSGAGRLKTGKDGNPRMVWRGKVRELFDSEPNYATPVQIERHKKASSSSTMMSYLLLEIRDEVIIKLTLPSDLSKSEAEKIARYIQAIPEETSAESVGSRAG